MNAVLDASAALAWLRHEPGADQVDAALNGGVISTVNASETAQKLIQHGADGSRAVTQLLGLGLTLTPFTGDDALAAADLWTHTRTHGLSLADRACLALAQRLQRPVLTSDQAWQQLDLDIELQMIR